MNPEPDAGETIGKTLCIVFWGDRVVLFRIFCYTLSVPKHYFGGKKEQGFTPKYRKNYERALKEA